jgi:hypothetical protein
LEKEISRQEVNLSKLHARIANEQNSSNKTAQESLGEELWALQRYITSLKRKVKKLNQERKALEAEQIKNLTEVRFIFCFLGLECPVLSVYGRLNQVSNLSNFFFLNILKQIYF